MDANASGPSVVVAGHLCLDITPPIERSEGAMTDIFRPGSLIEVGPVRLTAGGCVGNTGLALARLGVPVHLSAQTGDDLFGEAVRRVLREGVSESALHLRQVSGARTSYTIVISPPEKDRLFLHCAGTNESYRPADVELPLPSGSRLFHFGYPPLMPEAYRDGGEGLARLFRTLREAGVGVSLDMAMPDPEGVSGRVDWSGWLERVLPHVDAFLPSFDEISFMLGFAPSGAPPLQEARRAADVLLSMGAGLVLLKMGALGIYLRTSSRSEPIQRMAKGGAEGWIDRELFSPSILVRAAGTTGAGDSAIAGFLGACLYEMSPETAVLAATATGAFSVEKRDATSGIPPWDMILERIRRKEPRHSTVVPNSGGWDEARTLWSGR